MILNSHDELPEIREEYRDKKVVFCSGTFDLTHVGHVLFFEDCKKQGDVLVVAVGNDFNIREYKGEKRPVLNEKIRLKIIDSLKPVDYCVTDCRIKTEGDFLSALVPLLEKLKPDKWIVNEDAFDISQWEKLADKYGIELVVLKRFCPEEFENISTSKIIEKVKGLD
tara:strand:- start:1925 stop:2425 length:501 start_codon:yes stop_codon:yes gene_type:complete